MTVIDPPFVKTTEDEPLRRRSCGTMAVFHQVIETNPGLRESLATIEDATRSAQQKMNLSRLAPVTVPVVVHVIHREPAYDISQAQIDSQIRILNEDFAGANADIGRVPPPWTGLITNAHIQFKLATIDPSGAPTNGIVRVRTDVESFPQDDSMKFTASGGSDAWDTSRYLNIWVCDLAGLLGYGQFPGLPPETDGVVILTTAFGDTGLVSAPFNLGRTTTHEVGHFLNLRHIWGDTDDCSGTDHVADTPRQRAPNYNDPIFPTVSCDNGPHGDMFVNYMDYVNDASMVMFTSGQVARMRATLAGPRSSLVKGANSRT